MSQRGIRLKKLVSSLLFIEKSVPVAGRVKPFRDGSVVHYVQRSFPNSKVFSLRGSFGTMILAYLNRNLQRNLFKNIPKERFDQIFANGPFFEGEITHLLDYACYGAKAFFEGLLLGTPARLKTNGKLLIVLSVWSDLQRFKETAKMNRLSTTLIIL